MKEERTDMNLLLIILLLFSASVGILHGWKKNKIQAKLLNSDAIDDGNMANLLPEEIVIYLQPLVLARGIGVLAQTMHQFSTQKVYDVVRIILKDNQSLLSRDEKLKFIFALALQYPENRQIYTTLFDFIVEHKELLQGEPLLLVAARSKYNDVIPLLLSWSQRHSTHKHTLYIHEQPFSKALVLNALKTAIEHNDLEIVEILYSKGVEISPKLASNLLWQVVDGNKNTNFVHFLVRRGADVNFISPDHHTLLMKAVANNNKQMVQVLLDKGANIDILVDPSIGTAKQIAITHKYQDIRNMLDSYLMKS